MLSPEQRETIRWDRQSKSKAASSTAITAKIKPPQRNAFLRWLFSEDPNSREEALRARAEQGEGSPPEGMKSGLIISVSGKDEDEDRGRRPPRGWDQAKEAAKFGAMKHGQQVVEQYFKSMDIGASRCIKEGGRISWWLGPLRQQVWAEAPFEDEGITVTRVHARTDVFAGFTGSDSQLEALNVLMPLGQLSGFVRNADDPSRIQLACSVYVNESTLSWISQFFGVCAVIQTVQAYNYLEFERDLALRIDRTPHPEIGPIEYSRIALHGVTARLVDAGNQRSHFIGDDMRSIHEECQAPACVLATGDDVKVTAEFPFLGRTSLMGFSATEVNPNVGSGMLMTLKIPDKPANGVMHALQMNERELNNLTRSHFIGSWCPIIDGRPTFASFVPNILRLPGLAQQLAQSMMMRAKWVAEAVYGDDWIAGGYQKTMEQKVAVLEHLTGQLGTQKKSNKLGFLGRLFRKGGRPVPPVSPEDDLRAAEENGCAGVQYNLGLMHHLGDGVPKDSREAVKWYRLAADQGYAAAQSNLGVMYADGDGVAKESVEAVKWYRKAADQGYANAQFNLAVMYATGEGVPKDSREAVKWCRLAADQGDASAQYNLGLMYHAGDGVAKDLVEGLAWTNIAAASGEEIAGKNLSLLERQLGPQVTLAAKQRSKEILKEIEAAK